ncbi:VOC family protein [Candidatus Saccharibacteria bacterium]|nr:VOC family protein [Candidatus Saccharibacteria bacterium]
MKITSLVFWVADATLSYKFYKKLGFEVGGVNERHAVVRLGDIEIMLVTLRDEDDFSKDALAKPKGFGMYVYIQVEDVDMKHKEVLKLGLKPSSEPRTWEWGNREFVIKDPDGYKLCFYQKVGISND